MTSGLVGAAIGNAICKVLATLVGGGVLLEGAALSGAKALEESHSTISKVAKCALAAIALIGALAATVGLGIFAFGFGGAYFTPLAYEELAVSIGHLTGAFVALGAMLIHWEAFKWSGLVTQQDGLRDRVI